MDASKHTVISSLPPNVLVGYLDVVSKGLEKTIINMEENEALNSVFLLIEESIDQVESNTPKQAHFMPSFISGMEELRIDRETLINIYGIARKLRHNLSENNGISAECQYTTPAFQADILMSVVEQDIIRSQSHE